MSAAVFLRRQLHITSKGGNNNLEVIGFGRARVVLLKGCQRRMIKISGRADTVFEDAYFILKPEREPTQMSERELITEANRIIRENSVLGEKVTRREITLSMPVFLFLTGLCTAGVFCSIFLLTVIF